MAEEAELVKRKDGKYGFRLQEANGRIVMTDGGQGYDHVVDAHTMFVRILRGEYSFLAEEIPLVEDIDGDPLPDAGS